MRQTLLLLPLALALGCAGEGASAARQAIGGDSVPSTNESVVFLSTTTGTTCTGTVVGPHHVLTAKTCVYAGGTAIAASEMRVYVGPDVRSVERMLTVAEIIATPGPPSTGMTTNELAMLVTREPADLPILALASTSPAIDDELTIVGYGQTDDGGSGVRREATLLVSEVMDGVFLSEGPGGICSGDSSPAIAASGEVMGIGFYTYGLDGSEPTCPSGSGFVDVSAHTDWLAMALAATPPVVDDAGATTPDAATPGDDAGAPTTSDAGGGTVMGGGCAVGGSASALPIWLVALAGVALARRRRA